MRLPLHDRAIARRARAAFVAIRGDAEAARRELEIAGTPDKVFKGVTVYSLWCIGGHEMWVAEYVLWSLISLDSFFCPYHRP